MNYPWLDVPILTAPMLIAVVALLHVFVSHYAVGGGILLALENGRARKDGDAAYLAYLKKHAGFFITLTVTYGALTGVGIWFAIGLASPLATEVLIKIFAFGWAIEWCFFLLELASGFIFYYFWDRLSDRASSFVGWTYAFAAWISLVLITGITSFMLNSSGLVENWEASGSFWDAFLNVQFAPQATARTGCALTLGSFYFLLHVSLFCKDAAIRERVTRGVRVPAFLGVFLLVCGSAAWCYFLSESSAAALERAAATNIFAGLFVGVIGAIVLLLFFGPVLRPKETSVGTALALFLLGIAGISASEFAREAVRKPYVVDRVVYSHQITPDEVKLARRDGLLYRCVWTNWELEKLQEKEEYNDLKISAERFLGWESTRLYKIELEPESEQLEEESENVDEELSEENTQNEEVRNDALLENELDAPRFVRQTSASAQLPSGGFIPTSTVNGTNDGLVSPAREYPAPTQPTTPTQPVASAQSVTPAAQNALSASQTPLQNPQANSVPVELETAADSVPDASVADEEAPEKSPEELDLELNGPISRGNPDLLLLSEEDRLLLGRAVFMRHCNCCHAEQKGYSAIAPLIVGRSQDELKKFALRLNYSHYYMPPWSGTEVEADLLAEYLTSIRPKYPKNVFQGPNSATAYPNRSPGAL